MISLEPNDLMKEILDGKEALKPFLMKRAEVIRHMAGKHWRSDSDLEPSPENYAFSYKTFVLPQLLYGPPTVKVAARTPIHSETAEAIEGALNYWGKETSWRATLDAVLNDCFVGFGMTKAGVSPVGDYQGGGLHAVEGDFEQVENYPFVVRVDPTTAIIDAQEKVFTKCRILGHTYERDMDDLRTDQRNDPEAVAQLSEAQRQDERKNELNPYPNPPNRAKRKRVTLHEVYLPEHGVLMTLGEMGTESAVVLRQEKFWGPDEGPYTLWGLETIPGEMMPISPLIALWDEYLEVTTHSRAAARSAMTHKKLVLVDQSGAEDGKKIQDAESGDVVTVKNPAAAQEVELGGASQYQLSFTEFVRGRYETRLGYGASQQGVAGNKTATGEQIANQNSDLRIDRQRDRIAGSMSDAYRKVAWYFHNDPSIGDIETRWTDPMTGAVNPSIFKPGPWDGGFVHNAWVPPEQPSDTTDYDVTIDPSSMTKTDSAVEQRQGQDLLTLGMQLQSMGLPTNMRRIVDIYGERCLGMKDLAETIILDQGMMLPPDPFGGGQPLGPTPGALPAAGGGPRPMPAAPQPMSQLPAMLGAAQRPRSGTAPRSAGAPLALR